MAKKVKVWFIYIVKSARKRKERIARLGIRLCGMETIEVAHFA
jgi:hypothetical protein